MNLEPLIYWVRAREAIRIRKEAGEMGPLTDDSILATYRFCNVRREDDRVTKWIDEKIRQRYADHHHLWFMLCAARMINWPFALADLIDESRPGPASRLYPNAWPDCPSFSPAALGDAMEDRASMGLKVFTGAYVIPAPGKGETKGRFLGQKVLGQLWRERARFESHFNSKPTMRSTHQLLTKYDFWGPFLAYQAIVDMRFTHLLRDAEDTQTWCAAGPGTIRGLNRLHGRKLDHALPQHQAMQECRDIYQTIQQDTGVTMDFSDVPNILCETDKYLRVKNKEGTPRALYVPGRGA